MNNLIIIHPGGAHFDELFAVSLILAAFPDTGFSIQRRNPTPRELDDANVWVIDVGGRHQPEKKNFDHHQSLDIDASFILVAQHLNFEHRLSVHPWWTYKNRIDRFGSFKTAAEHGIERLDFTDSPLESWFLNLFAQNPTDVLPLLRSFGQRMLDEADALNDQFNFWQSCETIQVKNKTVIIGLTSNSTGSQRFSERMKTPASVCLSYDRRGNGWRLARLNDASGINFSRLEGHAEIKFAHKSGFVAKTRERLPLQEVLALVKIAL
jgi:hypothetical protein